MDKFYQKEINEIYSYFNSSIDGLTSSIINKNLRKYGKNQIKEKERKSTARIFLEQFQDMLVIILIISAIISIFLGEIESTIVIFIVLTINAVMGTYQYQKAEKSLNSLRNLSSPMSLVVRNKEILKIHSYELVCGDIVIVNTGDIISADGRIIEEESLEINESELTGESMPVKKDANAIHKEEQISEQKNMLFSSTFCTKGHGKYIVTNVGMDTEIGKIAKELNEIENKKTPLQNSLDIFSKYLAILIIGVCAIVFIIGIYRNGKVLDSLMFAVALAVAAIPEALSTIVVIVLAIGTEKMAKENAIIKDLKAVESLGCISVICTDKTGTLTTNQMQVKEVECYYKNIIDFKKYILLSTNFDIYQANTNPTEVALIQYAKEFINIKAKKLQEIPFTSDRKFMSNLYKINNKNYIFSKGGLDIILEKCSIIDKEYKLNLNHNIKKEIINKADSYAKNGRRIIAFAYKEISLNRGLKLIGPEDENNLTFLGFATIIDPPRLETKDAVYNCKRAGIKPVMLTGDYINTAVAIGKDIGIYKEGDLAITGAQLNQMSQQELEEKIENITVYARLNPNQKIRIVEAWQNRDKIVAMTGVGINDAFALAKANFSISMGNGTEVAKDASSMILLDNNFNTIIKSVANGRKIYLNIQNAIRFLISGNLAAILLVLLTSFLRLPIPFLAVHLLFINLLTDSLPAIAIGMQDSQGDLLKDKPRNKKEHFVTKRLVFRMVLEGLLIFISCLLGYLQGLKYSITTAQTMAFAILCMGRLFHSLNCATRNSFLVMKQKNKFLMFSLIVGLILINSVLFVPFLKPLLQTATLNKNLVLSIYGYCLLPTLIIQMVKLCKK